MVATTCGVFTICQTLSDLGNDGSLMTLMTLSPFYRRLRHRKVEKFTQGPGES
jgi:hypothetical protein